MYVIQINRKKNWWKSETGTSFNPVFRVCPDSAILPYVYTHPHLHITVTRMANGRNMGTFQKAVLSWQLGNTGLKTNFTFFKVKISSALPLTNVLVNEGRNWKCCRVVW
jgi:hypothetical protein